MIRRIRSFVLVRAVDSSLACSWDRRFWAFARRVLG